MGGYIAYKTHSHKSYQNCLFFSFLIAKCFMYVYVLPYTHNKPLRYYILSIPQMWKEDLLSSYYLWERNQDWQPSFSNYKAKVLSSIQNGLTTSSSLLYYDPNINITLWTHSFNKHISITFLVMFVPPTKFVCSILMLNVMVLGGASGKCLGHAWD